MNTIPGDPNDDVMMSSSPPSLSTQQCPSPRSSDNMFSSHLLSIVAAGNIPNLPPNVTAIDSNETLNALFTPFLPFFTRLQASRRAPASMYTIPKTTELDAMLLRVEKASRWRQYAQVFADLTPSMLQAAAPSNSELAFRRFESGSPAERVMIVLCEWLLAAPASLESSELFLHEIYQEEIAVILVHALASSKLQMMQRTVDNMYSLVRKALAVPIGPVLLSRLATNDPSSVEDLVIALVAVVVATTTEKNKTMAQQEQDVLNTVTLVLENATDACIELAKLTPLYAARLREKLSQQSSSLYCAAMTFELLVTYTSEEDMMVFLYQWLKRDGALGSALQTYLQLACQEITDRTSKFQHNAASNMAKIRTVVFNLLHNDNNSRYQLTVVLGVCIGLQVLGSFPLNEKERLELLQSLDKLAPSLSSRGISLVFLVIVLVWYPLAPELSKAPGQRDEHLKHALTLSQKIFVSLFHAREDRGAGPLFVVSAVLFYTKAPALVPFLASVIGSEGGEASSTTAGSKSTTGSGLPVQQRLRAEYLHVVGDVVLKSVLTESLLAREILTFPPVKSVSAFDAVPSGCGHEFTLSALHGLLCEKSFLRHHHGHRLETWLATQIGEHAALPVHPLLVSLLLEWVENYVMAFEYPIAQAPRRLQLSIVPLRSATLAKWLASPCLSRSYRSKKHESEHELAWARGVLGLTYALQFNQRLRHATMVAGSKLSSLVSTSSVVSGASISSAWGLGADICLRYDLSAYPLRNIVTQALAHGNQGDVFEFVAPTLLKLVMEEHPQLFDAAPTRISSNSAVQLLPLASPSPDVGEKDVRKSWFRRRRRQRDDISQVCVPESPVSWKLLELQAAPLDVVMHELRELVDGFLPYAVVSPKASVASCHQVAAFCVQLATLYETRIRREEGPNVPLMMRLVHALCYSDALWRQQQLPAPRGKVMQLVTYMQVLEDPSRLLQDAHDGVFRHPALVRLLLSLVRDLRVAANVHVTKCDPSLVPVETMAGMTSTFASVQQHQLLQDCVVVHCLLKRLQTLSSEAMDDDDVVDENRALICTLVDELLSVEGDISSSSPPRLLLTLHLQGYDVTLVPLLVANVPSMKLLWDYWMTWNQSSAASTASGSSSRGATPPVKPLMEFVAEGAEKDVNKWRFRLRVVCALCAAHLCGDRQSAAMQQALRVVWNKLRHGLGSSGETCSGYIDLLSEVLPWIVDACWQHADLSAELVHFLLKLQRQCGSSSHRGKDHARRTGAGAGRAADAVGKPQEERQVLEQILHDTYASLLQHI